MKKRVIDKLIDEIDESLQVSSMLGQFQLGLALKIIEDRIGNIDSGIAQRCNDLQHRIFGDKV